MSNLQGRAARAPDRGAGTVGALRVRGLNVFLTRRDGTIPLVYDVDLDIARGEFVALVGESGSGKSVTARAIMGIPAVGVGYTATELVIAGHNLLTADRTQRQRLLGDRMSLVLQDALSALNPVLSIGSQLVEMLRVHRDISRKAARARAIELLALVGIPGPEKRIDEYPHQFSGGMRQRILIAMAVALDPDLLVADEPTTALDVTIQAQILALLDRLRQELGMGVLLITHDLGVVNEVADRVAVMYAGRIVESGTTPQVLDHPSHPYTVALLGAVPQAGHSGVDLVAIPGTPPSAGLLPTGCAFNPRCTLATDICRRMRPELRDVVGGQLAACHHSEELTRELTATF